MAAHHEVAGALDRGAVSMRELALEVVVGTEKGPVAVADHEGERHGEIG